MNSVTDLPGERWLPVVGYEENYWVSSMGRLWSRPRRNTRGGLLRASEHKTGYLKYGLSVDGVARSFSVHLLVAPAFLGPCPPGQEVRHLDGNQRNNEVGNLAYGTSAENARDRVLHGHHENTLKTHCPQGHPYDQVNTYTAARGDRQCRICMREARRRCDERARSSRSYSSPNSKATGPVSGTVT